MGRAAGARAARNRGGAPSPRAGARYHAAMAGTVRFLTFGCKANQYDTQVLREALLRHGWLEGSQGSDLVVMNTCTVTAEAGRR